MPPQKENPLPKGKERKGKEINNPRRLLILSPSTHSHTLIPSLLKALTGHAVAESQQSQSHSQSFAGYTTHPPLKIQNRYYTAEVPVWVDEIPTSTLSTGTDTSTITPEQPQQQQQPLEPESVTANPESSNPETPPSQWAREFSSAEAKIVRDAIGAVMICIRNPSPTLSIPVFEGQENQNQNETVVKDENRADVRALKTFIHAIGDVRALIEEERGEIGGVPGLLVLGGKRDTGKEEKKDKKAKKEGGSEDLDLDLEIGDGFDEPFSIPWWEDQLCEMGLIGFEVVEWDGTVSEMEEGEGKRNQYGELQGMRRIKEVLETHEWAGDEDTDTGTGLPGDDDDLERELLGLDGEGDGFNAEVNELEREMVGLRFTIGRGGEGQGEDEDDEGDEEIRVDAVEALLMRMRAIKDMSDELPENDRKRFAAKAVRDIMKEM
ncbi:alpha and gamma adaptin binding protein p34-domain-containing protein [Aspergillus cavernicola]|uniref:Alpha and gamma adaptin binding protein p34-domain-containing protein n=1 Tax=Aspergillus cavernicola TaxID=176166 RepID=A0ABR4J598_9EURO